MPPLLEKWGGAIAPPAPPPCSYPSALCCSDTWDEVYKIGVPQTWIVFVKPTFLISAHFHKHILLPDFATCTCC